VDHAHQEGIQKCGVTPAGKRQVLLPEVYPVLGKQERSIVFQFGQGAGNAAKGRRRRVTDVHPGQGGIQNHQKAVNPAKALNQIVNAGHGQLVTAVPGLLQHQILKYIPGQI